MFLKVLKVFSSFQTVFLRLFEFFQVCWGPIAKKMAGGGGGFETLISRRSHQLIENNINEKLRPYTIYTRKARKPVVLRTRLAGSAMLPFNVIPGHCNGALAATGVGLACWVYWLLAVLSVLVLL